jgi:hypothetical protein
MQDAQDTHDVARYVVDQDIATVRHQFARILHATRPADLGMVGQAAGLLGDQLIQGQGSPWVVGLDVVIDRTAVS